MCADLVSEGDANSVINLSHQCVGIEIGIKT